MDFFCPSCHELFSLNAMTMIGDAYYCRGCAPQEAPERPKKGKPQSDSGSRGKGR